MNVIAEELRVEDYLLSMGLHLERIHDALKRAISARMATSRFCPITARGTNFFNQLVAGVREQYCPMGWKQRDLENFATLEAPSGSLQLAFARGTAGTGLDDGRVPTTRSKRGPQFRITVDSNSLLPGIIPPGKEYTKDGKLTYVLLYNYDDKFIYCEVSKPVSYCDKDNRPDGWGDRVILPPIPLENAGETCNNNVQMDTDVPVEPK